MRDKPIIRVAKFIPSPTTKFNSLEISYEQSKSVNTSKQRNNQKKNQ